MSDVRKVTPFLLLAVGAAALIWFYCQEDEGPKYNKIDGVWSSIGYNPYAWWATHQANENTYQHVYPEKAAAGCMPTVIPNEEGSLSTTEADGKGVPRSG